MGQVTALWRGEIPLAKTGWLYGLLGLLLLIGPLLLLSALRLPAAYTPVVLALSVGVLGYAGFMAVAIWRSAGNYGGPLAWRLLAKGSIVFVALQVLLGVGVS